MVLDSLFPVFLLVILGRTLRHFGLIEDDFFRTSDRLIYYIFFPAMLFWKIGGTSSRAGGDPSLYLAVFAAVFLLYLLSLLFIRLAAVGDFQAGTFSQSCYRFNTYIGMAIVINACGEEGVRHFGILAGLVIPFINVLAVSTLVWYSGVEYKGRERMVLTGRALVSNPLILACLAGIIYSRLVGFFPSFLDNGLRLCSLVTLPLALLSIGGVLTPASVRGHFKLSAAAAGFKLAILPVVGFGMLQAFRVPEPLFRIGMIFFCLPTSTAIYVLSGQLKSDTQLASAAIVLSTLLSFVSLSVVLSI